MNINTLSSKNKKILGIVISIFVVLAIIVASLAVFFSSSKGQEIRDNAQTQFQEIEIPDNTDQLTRVSEAPVGKQDSGSDGHVAVDLLGQKVDTADIPGNDSDQTSQSRNSGTNTRTSRAPRLSNDINERTHQMRQVSNTGKRVKISSIGFNIPLGAVNEVGGLIEPTNFTSVFWVRNKGVHYTKTNKGTTYLAAHALDTKPNSDELSGLAPGNMLYDHKTGQSRIHEGDIMEVGGQKFKFKSMKREGKGLISRDKDTWNAKKPNRLIFFSCYSNSNDNIIFFFDKV